jgi:hypothetical protein
MRHISLVVLGKTARKVGVLCTVACLLTAAAFGTPAIKFSTASGPPTTNLKLSGSGLAP